MAGQIALQGRREREIGKVIHSWLRDGNQRARKEREQQRARFDYRYIFRIARFNSVNATARWCPQTALKGKSAKSRLLKFFQPRLTTPPPATKKQSRDREEALPRIPLAPASVVALPRGLGSVCSGEVCSGNKIRVYIAPPPAIVRITGNLGGAFDNCSWLQSVKVGAGRTCSTLYAWPAAGISHASKLM